MLTPILLCTAILFCACSTTKSTPEEKAANKYEYAQKVMKAVDTHRFKIDISYMQPARGAAKQLDYGYNIRISGDTLYSNLPYYGRAFNIPYGGGKGLVFDAPIGKTAIAHGRKGASRMEIRVSNEEDNYVYTLDVYENGKATLNVYSRERESITFSGEMNFDY